MPWYLHLSSFQIKSHLHLHNMPLNAYFCPLCTFYYICIEIYHLNHTEKLSFYAHKSLIWRVDFVLSDALFLITFDLPWFITAYKTTLQLQIIKLFDSYKYLYAYLDRSCCCKIVCSTWRWDIEHWINLTLYQHKNVRRFSLWIFLIILWNDGFNQSW